MFKKSSLKLSRVQYLCAIFRIFLNLESAFLWVDPGVLESCLPVSICPLDFDIFPPLLWLIATDMQGILRHSVPFFTETNVKSRSTGNSPNLRKLKRKWHAYSTQGKVQFASRLLQSLCSMDSLTIRRVTMSSFSTNILITRSIKSQKLGENQGFRCSLLWEHI